MTENEKKYDYIFLDLDGPILEGKFRHFECYKNIINKYGGIPIDIETYWELKRNRIKRDVLLEKSNFKGTYDEFLNMWLENIEKKEYLKYDFLKPSIIETLKDLRNYTKKIYLVTMRNNRNNLMEQLDELGVIDLFDEILVCSSKNQNTKFFALKSITFQSAIMIGDTEVDVITAKKLGIKSVGITTGLRSESILESDYFIDELCNIDFTKISI